MPRYAEVMRRNGSFDDAAEAAKRELAPELFFSDHEPSITICRVCEGEGFHKEGCKLKNPDGKDKPSFDDLVAAAKDKPKAEKLLIDHQREQLKALDIDPKTEKKIKAAVEIDVAPAIPPPVEKAKK